MTAVADVFDRLSALADPTRARLLAVLEDHELTVRELCSVVQLPQSTVSRHLKVLSDDGWVAVRGEGTSRFYRMAAPRQDPVPHKLWTVVRGQVADAPAARQDARRLESVLRLRRDRSKSYFSTAAGDWQRVRTDLIGPRTDLLALLDLLDPGLVVGDLGCGTGQVTEALAPCVRRVVAVDESGAMLTTARRRFAKTENVDVRAGSLEALPVAARELDVAVMCLVLHFVLDPARALAEAHRVLRPRGRLLIVDFTPHARDQYTMDSGHVWQGFDASQLDGWLRGAGFHDVRYRELPADPAARGPVLFSALARRGRS
ncbi:MAG: metalloregulator ArsR/SmtB family transcription factor [Gemmatimonadota bacterium]|nr:metalloregulator ArsR/SmtB family transcription factor [Gemmatimonadota bacterium]MDE3172342.1 metalloregulator ArsR/SmtB family transcription factor [Gemmatimonadota bacterium]MDE3215461.1 metalloregulator ArsR/SmtB family transcription factor [Gemmatimonadota bacterium]